MKKYLILPFLMLASCDANDAEEKSIRNTKRAEENLNKTLPVGCFASYKGWHNFDGTSLPIVVIQCKDKSTISINASKSSGKFRTKYTTFIVED